MSYIAIWKEGHTALSTTVWLFVFSPNFAKYHTEIAVFRESRLARNQKFFNNLIGLLAVDEILVVLA